MANLLDGFNTERTEQIDPRRAPLKLTVERDVFELREALEQIDGRLRTHFPSVFIDSLYPTLDRNRRNLSDEDDDTDA